MGKPKRDIEVSIELGWTDEQTARALGLSPSKFAELHEQLTAWGFPKRHPLTGRYVVDQVRAWYNTPPDQLGKPRPLPETPKDQSGPAPSAPVTLAPAPHGSVSNLIADRLRNGTH